MHVLVTGGAGFIGSNLCAMLSARGFATTAVDAFRRQDVRDAFTDATLRYRHDVLLKHTQVIAADLLDDAALHDVMRRIRPDCIIHLAGQAIVSAAERDPDAANADILQSTIKLLEHVRRVPDCRRVVHVSSSMVYGHYAGDTVDEAAPLAPVNVYGGLKLAAEIMARAYVATTGIELAIVRPSAVYGPGEVSRRVAQTFCERALADLPIDIRGGADTLLDFTYVDDLCDGLYRAATVPAAAGETFNMTAGRPRSLADLVDCIRNHVPNLQCNASGPDETIRPRRGTLDIGKAKRLLGYAPTATLETGIARYLGHLSACHPRLVTPDMPA